MLSNSSTAMYGPYALTWPKIPHIRAMLSYVIGSVKIDACTVLADAMSIGHRWALLSCRPTGFHNASTIHSIPMSSTKPCLSETDAYILVAKGQFLFSGLPA